MKAHDVRHLCKCQICGGLADDREAIQPKDLHSIYRGVWWHPGCYAKKFGEEAVFELPADDRRKFRLCDVSADTMRRLVEGL